MVFYNQEIELRNITVQDVYRGDYRVQYDVEWKKEVNRYASTSTQLHPAGFKMSCMLT